MALFLPSAPWPQDLGGRHPFPRTLSGARLTSPPGAGRDNDPWISPPSRGHFSCLTRVAARESIARRFGTSLDDAHFYESASPTTGTQHRMRELRTGPIRFPERRLSNRRISISGH